LAVCDRVLLIDERPPLHGFILGGLVEQIANALEPRIPGIPATNLTIRIPFYAIVNIRGDRLYHEHISWDQGTVLRQLGLLPEYLPFAHHLAGIKRKKLQYKLPVAGVETALKLEDQRSVESNTLFMPSGSGIREV
jgi:carboxymethylenebutenolidase